MSLGWGGGGGKREGMTNTSQIFHFLFKLNLDLEVQASRGAFSKFCLLITFDVDVHLGSYLAKGEPEFNKAYLWHLNEESGGWMAAHRAQGESTSYSPAPGPLPPIPY